MTGFGRATAVCGHNKITAEVKSLNSKQFDLLMRVPGHYRELEPALRSQLAADLQRGKADLNITVENGGDEMPVTLNAAVMQAYKTQIEQICASLAIPTPQDWVGQLMRMPEVMHSQSQSLTEEETLAVTRAVAEAAQLLTAFRRQEGAKLEVFFRSKTEAIARLLEQVEPFEAERVTRLRERLESQLAKIPNIEADSGRLEQELIFYIEKLDVTEEKTRLRAHINYFVETMDGAPGQGKKLGFIAQEMGREINTLGSKSNNADMQRIVVKMKDELEQIKEQVLNVL